jgi:multiple sugar transport system ATP-binding protein
MASIHLQNIEKKYGGFVGVQNMSLEIADEEFLVLLGPSGCGKTTTMRMIAGLEEPTDGQIVIGGEVVNEIDARDRDVAMVFQGYALYPNMSIYENIRFPLRMRGIPAAEHDARIRRAADMVELGSFLDRKPGALSGGQRQRAALARAVVRQPQVFLMDEPLSNLDAKLRVSMRVEIKELHQRLKTTTVYVTHDQIEAMTMANKIVVMRDGRVEQIGRPLDLYDRPANLFVAGFIGSPSMNFLKGRIALREGRQVVETAEGIALPLDGVQAETGRDVTYGIRPEHISLGEGGIPVRVSVFEPTGSETLVFGRLGGTPIDALVRERIDGTPGETLGFRIDPRRAHVFDSATGNRL